MIKKDKKIFGRILNQYAITMASLSLLMLIDINSVFAENFVARMSGHWSPKHQSAIHSQIFADEVTKRSNGRLKIEFYPSKQLFGIQIVFGNYANGYTFVQIMFGDPNNLVCGIRIQIYSDSK